MDQLRQASERPAEQPGAGAKNSRSGTSSHEEDDFVDIDSADLEMQEADGQDKPSHPLDLQRFDNIGDDVDAVHTDEDDEEDSDDEHPMASHPLLHMLTGRLGGRRRGSTHKWDHLHPENQTLSVTNVEQCTSLEESAFPPEERASREKIQYRLTRCPELTLGLFTQPTKAEAESSQKTPERKLMAHIVSTRTPAPAVTDESMAIPADWKARRSSLPTANEKPLGHQDQGGTICVHSLAVAPEYQKMGLGTILMKSYIQRIKDSKSADRIALLAHDHLIPFYSMLGFENMGKSAVTFGGGNWNNMVLTFTHDEDD